MSTLPSLASATTLACLATALGAQSVATPPPGFTADPIYTSQGVQHGIAAMALTDDGQLFVAHQSWLYAVDPQGQRTLVHSLPSGHSFGPMSAEPHSGALFACDFTARSLIAHLPQSSQTITVGAIPANTFDLDCSAGVVLASANPSWPNVGAAPGIWHIDPPNPARELVRLRGASGPLAHDRHGNLYVVTVSATFPAPPGSSRLLRFTAAQLTRAFGGALLGENDATTIGAPLDGGYDLALDDRGHAYVSDGTRGQLWQIDLATGVRQLWLDTGAAGTTHLHFDAGSGRAPFAPFQPDTGAGLWVTIADWAAVRSAVARISPARPLLAASPQNPVPRGTANITVHGTAPSAPCFLYASPLPVLPEVAITTLNGVPLWFGLDNRAGLWTWPLSSDGLGRASWPFLHSGPGTQLTLQALTVTLTTTPTFGTSAPLSLWLQ